MPQNALLQRDTRSATALEIAGDRSVEPSLEPTVRRTDLGLGSGLPTALLLAATAHYAVPTVPAGLTLAGCRRQVSLRANRLHTSGRSRSVDIPAMAEANDQHDEPVVVNLVDDPIVTDAHSIHAVLPLEGDTPRRSRFVCEEIDRSPNPLLLAPWELSKRLDGSPGDLDFVAAHASPKSALTSSQGT